MEIDPTELSIRDRYKLLIGAIVPRPIAFVSTISPDGRLNLAPFSFFNGIGSNPMTVVFCPANNEDGSEKDTLRNCKPIEEGGVGEFVVNLAVETYARQMAATAEPLAYGQSEFDLSGLHAEASKLVRPPRVAESPVSFECRTLQVIRTNPGAASGGNAVIGQVVHVRVAEGVVDNRLHIRPEVVRAIGRMGGAAYCTTRDRFELPPGVAALDPNLDLEIGGATA